MKMKMKRVELIARMKTKLAMRTKELEHSQKLTIERNEQAKKDLTNWLEGALKLAKKGKWEDIENKHRPWPMCKQGLEQALSFNDPKSDHLCNAIRQKIEVLEVVADEILEFNDRDIEGLI